jgi:hypothetical protein
VSPRYYIPSNELTVSQQQARQFFHDQSPLWPKLLVPVEARVFQVVRCFRNFDFFVNMLQPYLQFSDTVLHPQNRVGIQALTSPEHKEVVLRSHQFVKSLISLRFPGRLLIQIVWQPRVWHTLQRYGTLSHCCWVVPK